VLLDQPVPEGLDHHDHSGHGQGHHHGRGTR
jgi:hypothetical protein